jgi:hypothetical protein
MRPDMPNLLVERGHAGTGWTRFQPKGWNARCRFRLEEDDQREAQRPPHRRPQFSENLSPLRRYLAAQVGRPWDKVYAEIRSRIDTGNAVQYHILQHLYDRLALKVWEDDQGRLWHRPRGSPEPLDARWARIELYVCPRTGLLRKVRRSIRVEAQAPKTCLPGTSPDHDYRSLAGQWYEVWWGSLEQNGALIRGIVRKRQLSRRELRDLGLRS